MFGAVRARAGDNEDINICMRKHSNIQTEDRIRKNNKNKKGEVFVELDFLKKKEREKKKSTNNTLQEHHHHNYAIDNAKDNL